MSFREECVQRLMDMYGKYYSNPDCSCTLFSECKHSEQCKFSSDKAMVGKEYGNDCNLPKIVFVGLEGVEKAESELGRNNVVKRVRETSLEASNPHYRGVRYVAAYLMSSIKGLTPPENAQVSTLTADDYINYLNYISLINMYKCAFGIEKTNLYHTNAMKTHCWHILLDEIDILQPDFLVVQVVSEYPEGLWEEIQRKYGPVEELKSSERNKNTRVNKLIHTNGKPFYYINTYHGNGGPFPRKKGGIFVNNSEYLNGELQDVLKAAIADYTHL